MQPSVATVLDFLYELYEAGLGYNAINTARCALSQVVYIRKSCTIGAHPWVVRFMKAVYNLRPPVPRYSQTWDVDVLLRKVGSLSPVSSLSLKKLTLKTVTLVAIILAARAQTLSVLSLTNMTKQTSAYLFTVGKTDLKQSRQGYTPPLLKLEKYPANPSKCVYTALSEYILRTEPLRGTERALFISYRKPHGKVGPSTISRWVKTMMAMAGIKVDTYRPHSVRAASTSKAFEVGVSLTEILNTAGWTNDSTFAKYYRKEVVKGPQFAQKVLEG